MSKPSPDGAGYVARLRQAVLGSGHLSPALRQAALDGAPLPDDWSPYAERVRQGGSRVTDAEVAALQAGGHDEDEIFEITVAAALGAALRSLDAGLRALQEGRPHED
jgi:hypothetical protein